MLQPLLSLTRGWRAALLLAVVALLSPGRAAAGCGDYVHILNSPAAKIDPGNPADHPAAPAERPCQGPNCPGGPDRGVPPSTPVAPSGPQVKELAGPDSPPEAEERPGSRFDRDSATPRPVRRASSVFHPPRLG